LATSLQGALDFESITCGDPYVRLSKEYSIDQLTGNNKRLKALIGTTWAVEAMFIAEVGILLLALIFVLLAACCNFQKNALSFQEFVNEFRSFIKVYKLLN
jgi:hypothetical protein